MDYFIENGIDNEVIKEVYDNYSQKDLLTIEHNRKNVLDVYNYFKNVGISLDNIKQLLLSDIDIFYIDLDNIKNRMEKYDLRISIGLLNNDIELINQII